mmetsp:Transcript_92559/g.247527  ORF Transcript_92559/g.247527 Transcript_92559/m.247527 type:complete len:388 (-) Transcript_92559:168-1331(-)
MTPFDRPGPTAEELATAPPMVGGVYTSFLLPLSQAVAGVASEDFTAFFQRSYGDPVPVFHPGSFSETCRAAREQKRLLAIWIHRSGSAEVDNAANAVIKADDVRQALGEHFLLWGGHVDRFEPHQLARLFQVQTPPALIIADAVNTWDTHTVEWPMNNHVAVQGRLAGPDEVVHDRVLRMLNTIGSEHTQQHVRRHAQSAARTAQIAADRAMREAQDEEFQQALEADRIAQEAADAAKEAEAREEEERIRKQAEEEERKRAEEAEAAAARDAAFQARAAAAKAFVEQHGASGPAKGAGVASLVVRRPDGSRLERNFPEDTTMEIVYLWVSVADDMAAIERGEDITAAVEHKSFQLLTSFPSKVLEDKSATLKELELVPSAALIWRAQ